MKGESGTNGTWLAVGVRGREGSRIIPKSGSKFSEPGNPGRVGDKPPKRRGQSWRWQQAWRLNQVMLQDPLECRDCFPAEA